MRKINGVWVVLFILMALLVTGCSEKGAGASEKVPPAYVESMEEAEFNHVVLTERAFERLDIQTDTVRQVQVDGVQRTVIPYSSVIYGLYGETWVYVSLDALTFTREAITIDYIDKDMVILTDGLDVGVSVATVGVAELYGIDTGVGK